MAGGTVSNPSFSPNGLPYSTSQAVRLSVSEPFGGYPVVDGGGNPYDSANDQYVASFDSPLDNPTPPQSPATNNPTNLDWITANPPPWNVLGRQSNFRIVHLQRLANPTLPWT